MVPTKPVLSILCVCVALLSSAAHAVCPRQDEGKAALRARDYPSAEGHFLACLGAATDAQDRWAALIGLGLTHDLAGRPVPAVLYYGAFLQDSDRAESLGPRWASRRARVRVEKGRLEGAALRTHGLVRVQSTPPGAAVTFEGGALPGLPLVTPVELLLPAGPNAVSVVLADHHPRSVTLAVSAGTKRVVTVPLSQRALTIDVEPLPEEGPLVVQTDERSDLWKAGWGLVGGGLALLATGGVLTGLAAADVDELGDISQQRASSASLARYAELTDRVQSLETSYAVLYGVGGAALVTGTVLAILGASDVTPEVSPLDGGALLGLTGRF